MHIVRRCPANECHNTPSAALFSKHETLIPLFLQSSVCYPQPEREGTSVPIIFALEVPYITQMSSEHKYM